MTVYYFRSMAGLHKFAHAPAHRAGWNWWNRTVKEHPHISIMHEVYEAPAGAWESIYVNYKPIGLGMYSTYCGFVAGLRLIANVVCFSDGDVPSEVCWG